MKHVRLAAYIVYLKSFTVWQCLQAYYILTAKAKSALCLNPMCVSYTTVTLSLHAM
jgi:hypothetical protein